MDSIVSLMGNFHTLYIMGLCGKTKVQNIRGLNAASLSAPFMLGAATGKAPGTAWKRWSYLLLLLQLITLLSVLMSHPD